MKRNIIFLDIDSVLNFSTKCSSLYDIKQIEQLKKLTVEDGVPLFKDNIAALNHIISNTQNLGIVWSTDWRLVDDEIWKSPFSAIEWKNPVKWLESQEWFNGLVIGKTPKKMSSNRFEEIRFWFIENMHAKKLNQKTNAYCQISNYAIIDDFDSPGMKRYGKHFFKCNHDTGLTMEQANDIVKYLSTDDFNEDELEWSK